MNGGAGGQSQQGPEGAGESRRGEAAALELGPFLCTICFLAKGAGPLLFGAFVNERSSLGCRALATGTRSWARRDGREQGRSAAAEPAVSAVLAQKMSPRQGSQGGPQREVDLSSGREGLCSCRKQFKEGSR